MQINQQANSLNTNMLNKGEFIYRPEEIIGGTQGLMTDSVGTNSVKKGQYIESPSQMRNGSSSRQNAMINTSKERVSFSKDVKLPPSILPQIHGSFDNRKSSSINSRERSNKTVSRRSEVGCQSILKPTKSSIDIIQPGGGQNYQSFNNICD